ncbi:unnamed protein product [Cyprideis torosa]|uniref:Uncharacterized protein n=1 Tax=Cyprideis torosa TaxID=163714 RepID=A0A7R8ZTR2_9CRUS|nr:unnamed protein product [Cyprideis torosa]CAG0907948.1 unnamed protein product [Cyprideis torosa]
MSIPSPETTPYALLGGEDRVRELVDRFYDHMDQMPEAYELREMHAEDLGSTRNKLFMFLSGWLGGPDLYIEAYGHPMLRRRHLPFAIDTQARDQWLLCMQHAMDDMQITGALRQHLDTAFAQTANHMRNQPL